jgi:hypothetical protein
MTTANWKRGAKRLAGTALLWAALSTLNYLPASDGGAPSAIVAGLGFLAFSLGLSWLLEAAERTGDAAPPGD